MTSPQVDILSPPYGPQIFPLIPYRAEVILMKFPIPQSHYRLMQVDAIMAADFDFRIVSGGSENHLPRYLPKLSRENVTKP